uniref:Uncharacterized protein n=1 Tax=viral metagenome TaxID=1070528 RepID=A0A6M3L1H6_9ZZZZ
MEELLRLAKQRLGNVQEILGQVLPKSPHEGSFHALRVIADAWDGVGGDAAVWECFIDSWDFQGSPWKEQDGICILPLVGDTRSGRQFVCCRLITIRKLRERCEDALRKTTNGDILGVADVLNIKL